MWKFIFFLAGIVSIIVGISKVTSNTTPVICNIKDIETGDFSKYDNFKISGGVILPGQLYYTYSVVGSGNVDQLVYPIFSQSYADSIIATYKASTTNQISVGDLDNWLKLHPYASREVGV